MAKRATPSNPGGIGLLPISVLLILTLFACSRPPEVQRDAAVQDVGGALSEPALPGTGDSAKLQGWEVTLLDFSPYEPHASDQPPTATATGTLVVADLRLRNLQSRPDDCTPHDFLVRTGDGRQFSPTPDTARIERGLAPRETIQSLQVAERRVLFDLPRDARDLVLEALEIEFSVPAPPP